MGIHASNLAKTCVVILLVVLSSPTLAADIYRWTDESGRVHYGERPPVDDARQISIDAAPSQASPPPDEAERRARQQRLLESFEYDRARKEEQQAEAQQQARQKARECEQLRQYWKTLAFAGPVYVEDDGGQRRYLDDAEREAEQASLRPRLQQACGTVPN